MIDIHIYPFLLASILVVIVPGPATIYVAGQAQHSLSSASYAVAGIVIGDIILMSLSAFGFASLVTQWPILIVVIKISGSLYIGYLGYGLIKAIPDSAGVLPFTAFNDNHRAYLRKFYQGTLITITNPKPILFFAAFFPLFIGSKTQAWGVSFYALGVLFEIVNLLYFFSLIFVFVQLQKADSFQRYFSGKLNIISGLGMLLFGIGGLLTTFYEAIH